MTLNLTSATSIREPGFSRSECLELARRIESDGIISEDRDIQCDHWDCDGYISRISDGLSSRQRNTIVAALRAYADV